MNHFYISTLTLAGLANAFIAPDEIPTLLSVIYSYVPPVHVGVDTRLGLGFRLGERSDFQTLLEIGPQEKTGRLAPEGEAKRRRQPNKKLVKAEDAMSATAWLRALSGNKLETSQTQTVKNPQKQRNSNQTSARKYKKKATPSGRVNELGQTGATEIPPKHKATFSTDASPTKFKLLDE